MNPLLKVDGLTAGYSDRPVLHEIAFEASAGESIALLGPNGSGKSTLIRALSRTIEAGRGQHSGRVTILDNNLESISFREVARLVSVVPQDEPQAFAFTVRELVTMGRLARSSGVFDTFEDQEAASKAMVTAECLEFADREVTELSGGERQRVLIARALAQDTPLMLLDEPTSHLDPPHQLAVAELIAGLSQTGKTIVTAVHDLNLAARFASRAILLHRGVVVLDAPVESVLMSRELEEVYGVKFERIRSQSDALVLVPHPT